MNILTVDDINFEEYEQDAETEQKLRAAPNFLNDVLYELMPAEDVNRPQVAHLPFANCYVDFREGETTLWGGFNNSGKSVLQGQIAALFASQGYLSCIASFEMKPRKTLARMVRQIAGNPTPTRNQVEMAMQRLDGLWLYDQHGSITERKMYAVARYCADKLKIKHMFIDSMTKCIRSSDDRNAEKAFINTIVQIGLDTGMHMHLVVHLKKGDGDDRMPTRLDIRGASEISDMPDNILLLWRNKRKERDRDQGKEINPYDPDAVLVCDKQRNGDWEGRVKLYYDKLSMRYADKINTPKGLAATLRGSNYQGVKG